MHRFHQFFLGTLVIATVGLGMARPASAGTMLDIYLGGAFTDESTLSIDTFAVSADFQADWDSSVTGGIRVGHWFAGSLRWFGLAADLSYFRPQFEGGLAELHMVPITPMVMLRIPVLQAEGYEAGRLQPYAAVGPGLFTAVLTSDVVSGAQVGFDVGLDVRAGLSILLAPKFGLFAEYRRTDVDLKVTDTGGDKLRTTLKTDHINAGIAFRF